MYIFWNVINPNVLISSVKKKKKKNLNVVKNDKKSIKHFGSARKLGSVEG